MIEPASWLGTIAQAAPWSAPTVLAQSAVGAEAPPAEQADQQAEQAGQQAAGLQNTLLEISEKLRTAFQSSTPEEVADQALALGKEYLVPLVFNLLGAIVVYFVGRWIAKFLQGMVRRLASRSGIDETLVKFLSSMLYALLMIMVILASLNTLGVNTTSVAAIVAAAGFAIGMALQGSLGNFAAGVLLILFKPFKVGDLIEAGSVKGFVEEIQIFSTLMTTFDNVQIIVPNSSITSGTITNFSAKPTRRIDLVVSCGYDDNLRDVKQFLEEIVRADTRVLLDPPPAIAVDGLGDFGVTLICRPWVRSIDYSPVKWSLTEAIKNGFDAHGFTIPYPTQEIRVHPASDAAALRVHQQSA